MAKWLDGVGYEKDVVISSRIRLARNIENIKFPNLINNTEAEEVMNRIKDTIINNKSVSNEYKFYKLSDLTLIGRKIFAENYLISLALLEKPDKSAFLINESEKLTIMINEEDHIRIQVLLPGLNLNEGWKLCSELDDILEENIKYAFDEKFGYLTTCPTNVGTGLRASVMVHLPSLVKTNQTNKILQAVGQIGLTVRGLYGEGTNAMGNLFQISNQTTLGQTEDEIIRKLGNVVLQIIYKERIARENLYNNKKIEIEDLVYRSLGILYNARLMSLEECMKLLSDINLGIDMGIINNISKDNVNRLLIKTQSANIQGIMNSNLNIEDINYKRAEIIRSSLIE